jgi:hypothetical protein
MAARATSPRRVRKPARAMKSRARESCHGVHPGTGRDLPLAFRNPAPGQRRCVGLFERRQDCFRPLAKAQREGTVGRRGGFDNAPRGSGAALPFAAMGQPSASEGRAGSGARLSEPAQRASYVRPGPYEEGEGSPREAGAAAPCRERQGSPRPATHLQARPLKACGPRAPFRLPASTARADRACPDASDSRPAGNRSA